MQPSFMRMTRVLLFLFLLAATGVGAQAQTIVRGPYLQIPTTESIVVRWRTDTAVPSQVRYGAEPGVFTMQVDCTVAKTEHFVKISGLQPNTKYYYGLYQNGSPAHVADSTYGIITNHNTGDRSPFRVWAIGDFGSKDQGQRDVRDSYMRWTGGKPADLWLWLGDNAYQNGTDAEYQEAVFTNQQYEVQLRSLAFYPVPGNHDYNSVNYSSPNNQTGPYYNIYEMPKAGEAGGVASGTEAYYSFDYGNVHFVALNSETPQWSLSSNNDMLNWLKTDLAATRQDWIVVYWHQPPYCKGSHDSDLPLGYMPFTRQNFNPICERYGVDLIMGGHSHDYERSYFINGHYGNSSSFNATTHTVQPGRGNAQDGYYYKDSLRAKGTVYVVCGSSGKLETDEGPMNHKAMVYNNDEVRGSLVIDFHADTLHAQWVTVQDQVLDEFYIVKNLNSTTS